MFEIVEYHTPTYFLYFRNRVNVRKEGRKGEGKGRKVVFGLLMPSVTMVVF